jgi:hypothetical protein
MRVSLFPLRQPTWQIRPSVSGAGSDKRRFAHWTFVTLPLGLLLVAVLAAVIPAACAVRVNPVVALRGE